MKKLVYIVLFLPLFLMAQTTTENYVLNKTYRVKSTDTIKNPTKEQVTTSIQYFDGLGRAKQSVLVEGGGMVTNKNGLNYDWTIGNIGSTVFFSREGLDSENTIVNGTTPFGDTDLLWECKGIQDNGGSQGDGGWITDPITIDKTQTYRYSVWVKRNSQDGHTYFGVTNIVNLNGSSNGNAYFWTGDLPQIDTWYLMVGIVHPDNYSGVDTNVAGVYDTNGNKVLDATEFKWQTTITTGRFRNYLFYATNPNVRQYFWSPLVQEINGTELSLNEVVNTHNVVIEGEATNDIVTHYEYDEFGRQKKEYLPYSSMTNGGNFRNGDVDIATKMYHKNKYAEDFAGVSLPDINLVNAYSEKGIENSPLNRIVEQGAPGSDWKISSTNVLSKGYSTGHTIKFDYDSNIANEVKIYYVTTTFANNTYSPTLQGGSNSYSLGELTKTITKDENWTENQTYPKDHTTEEFKNKQGQVILKRTYNNNQDHDTFYVYDDFGNLTYVIPPKAEGNIDKPDTAELSELCYQYIYDHRNRLVEKKIPGKGLEYIVYDELDRPVATQDANLRLTNKWLFTKYDQLGRVIYTGLMTNSSSRTTMQPNIYSYVNYENRETLPQAYAGSTIYYLKNSFPQSFDEIHTVNYYDTYVDLPTGLSNTITTSYNVTSTTNTKGLATVSNVRVLGVSPQKWITTVSYYDEKARPIYVYSENEFLNTIDIIENKLDDFTGKLLETKTTHTKDSNTPIVTIDRFEYDHQDRLISQTQKINDQISERIVKNNYDDIGQLESKIVGNGTKSGYTNISQGITVSNNLITKVGSHSWDTGLITLGKIQMDGYVEFTAMHDNSPYMTYTVGLSSENSDGHYSSIEYAVHIEGKRLYIFEGGNNKGYFGELNEIGDIYKVERIGEKIYYKRNGKAFYTSQTLSTGELVGDVCIYHTNATIKDFKIVDNSNGLQKVDYKYNVRGWLKKINDTDNLGSDLFSFKINYNTNEYGATNLFNGNISETIWKTPNDGIKHSYKYTYDALNRITYGVSSDVISSTSKYSLHAVSYDKNGNIINLHRNGHLTENPDKNNSNHWGLMDNLIYSYDSGNKLTRVTDYADKGFGFKDGTNLVDDYTYDDNGNMTKDLNKKINTITYNHLNLPTKVTLDSNVGDITYIYDATGIKQKKEVFNYNNGWTTTTTYAGNYTYINENGGGGEELQFFNHPEGYVKFDNGVYNYVYQYKDHLGNVRLSYTDNTKSYENIIDSDFTDSFDGWKQNGSVDYTLENGKLKVNVQTDWEGIRYNFQNFIVKPGENYTFKIKFDKANTVSNVRFYVVEEDENHTHLRFNVFNGDIQTGEYRYNYTVGSNAKYIRIHLDKDNTNTNTETQFYVDYITFTKGSLDIIEESNYYPFGLKHKGYNNVTSSNGNSTAQKFGYQGKELSEELGLEWHDFGFRNYDASLGRWMNIDPLAEKFESYSPYNAMMNNPILMIDPDGRAAAPIYDEEGAFLGTDDEGLQGDAIVMSKDDFKQGMSHSDAVAKDVGEEGMTSADAILDKESHFEGLKSRPDYDGKVTLSEANKWFREGNGESLFVNGAKIDLSPVKIGDFKDVGKSLQKNFFLTTNTETGLVYGSIKLTLDNKNGSVTLGNKKTGLLDVYDFDIKKGNGTAGRAVRNAGTKLGKALAGKGNGFKIYSYGKGKVKK